GVAAVQIMIEIAWHRLVANPAGDTQMKGKLLRRRRFNGQCDSALPRVICALGNLRWPSVEVDGGAGADIEIDIDILPIMGIGIPWQRGQETHDIGRTARTVKPGLAFERVAVKVHLAIKGQWVDIEEAVAAE